jgi:signal transduction histidine kinase
MGLTEVAKVTVKDSYALELFDKVKETARALDKMLLKLQSISDVAAQELVFKPVLIEEIFQTVCDSFQEEIVKKGIRTYCEVLINEAFVSYPAMIRIIIENLIENSVTFSLPVNPFVQLKAWQTHNSIQMEFKDNGQGVPRQYHDRVFDMYFRASERSKGNGLGLYIVKKAVEKLNGIITFESDHGKGTSVTILLPMYTLNS